MQYASAVSIKFTPLSIASSISFIASDSEGRLIFDKGQVPRPIGFTKTLVLPSFRFM